MYNIGDMVAYGAQGVCRVDEIASRQFGGAVMDYYILKPVFDSRSTISVPVANERLTARMRKPLDARQAGDVVAGIGEAQSLWISDDNLRRERYNAVIIDGDPSQVAALFKTLVLRKKELEGLSRKLRSVDENFLRQCEKMLCCELSYAGLGCQSDIKEMLLSRVL